MPSRQHFTLLADYNRWMNARVYEAAARLDDRDLVADRGAYFGSILGTLNHIVTGDTIWLQRFAVHGSFGASLREVAALPAPVSLDKWLFDDLNALAKHRAWLDGQICQWVGSLTDEDLGGVLHYTNIKGIPARKTCSNLLLHFFNHHTHHRGQVTTLLSQAGVDVGVTDLLALIPDESDG
ncbi:MAG: DinB family protein [Bacteroidales bacterium]|nr:DinB family protein [Bacteroidales bacterium]